MDFSIFKVPHKWWHFFFTSTHSWGNYGDNNRWVKFKCKKCRTIYHLKHVENDYKRVEVN